MNNKIQMGVYFLTFLSSFDILSPVGALAQLGARLNGIQEATSSSLVCSTLKESPVGGSFFHLSSALRLETHFEVYVLAKEPWLSAV